METQAPRYPNRPLDAQPAPASRDSCSQPPSRLFRSGQPLQADLKVESLDANPFYGALSYVWDHKSTAGKLGNTLLIDGHEVPVTAHPRTALRHLRPPAGLNPYLHR